jgi:hypothetical protein
VRPTIGKSCLTLLNEVKTWIAHLGRLPSNIWLRSIQSKTKKCVNHWPTTAEKRIPLTSCDPLSNTTHHPANTTVNLVKDQVRQDELRARTGAKLRALCYAYSGHQTNRIPVSRDQSKRVTPVCYHYCQARQGPCSPRRIESAHVSQAPSTVLCILRSSHQPRNSRGNSRPQGLAPLLCPKTLSLCDKSGGSLVTHTWSQPSCRKSLRLETEGCAVCTGSGWSSTLSIQVSWDQSGWKATCHSVITRSNKVYMHLLFTGYLGEQSTLPKQGSLSP